jgi:hypothetical protein
MSIEELKYSLFEDDKEHFMYIFLESLTDYHYQMALSFGLAQDDAVLFTAKKSK